MKRKSVIVLLTVILVGSLFALNKGETELENNGWFRYTTVMPKFDFANATRGDFTLERGYIRLSHQWTNDLFSKMTVDVLSSSSYADGASIRLKEAYIDYNLPLKETKFTAGLQKNYFSLICSWDYTNIEKSLADKEGVLASADYGLTLNGYLPKGLGEWERGAYNGEGYKKVFATSVNQVNKVPAWVANLRLTPIGGITVGSSVLYNAKDMSAYKNAASLRSGDTLRFNADTNNLGRLGIAPMAKVALGPVSVLGEYIIYNYKRDLSFFRMTKDSAGHVTDSTLNSKDKKFAMNGFSVVPVVSLLKRKLELVGRYDMWNVKADNVKDTLKSHTLVGLGANWHFARREKGKPGCELQLGWEREQPVAKSVKPTDTFMAQFRFEWTGLITPQ
jgi:hypothetical protein